MKRLSRSMRSLKETSIKWSWRPGSSTGSCSWYSLVLHWLFATSQPSNSIFSQIISRSWYYRRSREKSWCSSSSGAASIVTKIIKPTLRLRIPSTSCFSSWLLRESLRTGSRIDLAARSNKSKASKTSRQRSKYTRISPSRSDKRVKPRPRKESIALEGKLLHPILKTV